MTSTPEIIANSSCCPPGECECNADCVVDDEEEGKTNEKLENKTLYDDSNKKNYNSLYALELF